MRLANVIRLQACAMIERATPCQERGSVRNFSRNRPEATNLNHQYASRRVFMSSILDPEMAPHVVINAETGTRV
jgi:hypothetical protein